MPSSTLTVMVGEPDCGKRGVRLLIWPRSIDTRRLGVAQQDVDPVADVELGGVAST